MNPNSIKVIYDYQAFVIQRAGGVSRYVSELIKSQDAKIQTEVFLGLHDNIYIDEDILLHTTRVLSLDAPRMRGRRKINRCLWNLWSRFQSCNIYHQTYYYDLFVPRKARRVLTVHDFIDERHRSSTQAGQEAIIEKHYAIKSADFIICVSRQTQSDLIEYCGVREERTAVVYLGCSELFKPNYGERENIILFVGERAGYKNFNLLKTAYGETPDLYKNFKLVCFGKKPPLPTEYPPNGVLEFVSGDDKLLSDYYRKSAVFVYPSFYEGFGLPVIESLRSGCPLITSGGGSIREIAGKFATYFTPSSVDSLREALLSTLSASPNPIAARAAYEYSLRFTWENCRRDTYEIYRSLL